MCNFKKCNPWWITLDKSIEEYFSRGEEAVAEESDMSFKIPVGYEALGLVLSKAIDQAAHGKGKERHANGEPFEQQKICRISRAVGVGFAVGQAMKKAEEALRLEKSAGLRELLGAINYLAAAYIVINDDLR